MNTNRRALLHGGPESSLAHASAARLKLLGGVVWLDCVCEQHR